MSRSERGTAFVISGPSGVGKSSLLKRVLERDPELRFSVSHTTRPPRAGEEDGRDYFFVDEARFRALVDEGGFLEWAEYQGNLYGTSFEAVREPTEAGHDLILEVEVQGARQLRERLPGAVFVFIVPPSMEVLEQRLRGRGSDAEAVVQKRLERAGEELRERDRYDHEIVNDGFDQAVRDLCRIMEETRSHAGDKL